VCLLQQEAVRHDDSHEGAPGWQDRQCQQQCLHVEEAVQDVRHSRQRICEFIYINNQCSGAWLNMSNAISSQCFHLSVSLLLWTLTESCSYAQGQACLPPCMHVRGMCAACMCGDVCIPACLCWEGKPLNKEDCMAALLSLSMMLLAKPFVLTCQFELLCVHTMLTYRFCCQNDTSFPCWWIVSHQPV